MAWLKDHIRFCFVLMALACPWYALAQAPKADFTASKLSGCSPLTVSFTNKSTGTGNTYLWRFGNGNTSNFTHASAIFVQPGVYTITLIATNASGVDSIVKTAHINVFGSPVANFSVSPTGGCVPLNTGFTDQSTAGTGSITTWTWDFGDGGSSNVKNPNKVFTTAGIFSVTLIVADNNGCEGRVTKNNIVNVSRVHTVDFTASQTFKCDPTLFTSFSPVVTPAVPVQKYEWDFGDGQTSTTGSPNHNYGIAGKFNVSLKVTSTNGCVSGTTKKDFIYIPGLKANFSLSAPPSCQPTPVLFTNLSTPDTSIVTYTWSGPGYLSVSKNPPPALAHNNGPHTYRLITRIQSKGCEDTFYRTINIVHLPKPDADFNTQKLTYCKFPATVNFNNVTTGGVSYQWFFGDGSQSTAAAPTKIYNKFDWFDVTLVAKSVDGCYDTMVKPGFIKVTEPGFVVKSQHLKSGCVPLSASFAAMDTSLVPLTHWEWKFDSVTTSTNRTPNCIFPDTGIFPVTVRGYNSDGCEVLQSDTVYVGHIYPFDFDVINDTGCYSTYNDMLAIDPDFKPGKKDTVIWYFMKNGHVEDARQGVKVSSEHVGLGTFDVGAVVSIKGCRNSLFKSSLFTILGPRSGFKYAVLNCARDSFRFTSFAEEYHKLQWLFPDSSAASGTIVRKKINGPGLFYVSLVAFDTITGCTDTFTLPIEIPKPPVIKFNISDTAGCAPLSVTLSNASVVFPPISMRSWSYASSDGQFSPYPTASFVYTKQGYFRISFTATDSMGCRFTYAKDSAIHVYSGKAQFNLNPPKGCIPLPVAVASTSITDNPIVKYTWRWGDGDSTVTTSPTPIYVYDTAALIQSIGYNIVLAIEDDHGCTFVSPPKKVVPTRPIAAATLTSTKLCGFDSLVFKAENLPGNGIAPLSFRWNITDGSINFGPVLTRKMQGDSVQHTALLTVTDANGCEDTVSLSFMVDTKKMIPGFTASPMKIDCYKPAKVIHFTDTSKAGAAPIKSYFWNFGDNTSSALQHPDKVYTKPGLYNVSVEITDDNGCKESLYLPGFIVVGGPYGTYSFSPKRGCMPSLTTTFTCNSPNALLYIWDHADGSVDTFTTGTHTYTYTHSGVYFPRLTLVDSSGTCDYGYDAVDTIHVTPQPEPDFSVNEPVICKGTTVTFINTTPAHHVPINGWVWGFAPADSTYIYGPVNRTYLSTGVFAVTLKATDVLGCTKTIVKDSMIKVFYDKIAPEVPYLLRATVEGNDRVLMQLSANREEDFKQYVLYHNFSNGIPGSTSVIKAINDTNYVDSNLNTLANTYSYRMYAMDVCLNASDTGRTHTTVELTATAQNNAISLKWNNYLGWNAVDRYEIWRNNPVHDDNFYLVAQTSPDTLFFTDTSITCHTSYVYKIRAVEKDGKQQVSWSDTSAAAPVFEALVPGTRNIRATVWNNQQVRLEWNPKTYKLPFRYAIYRGINDQQPQFYRYVDLADSFMLDEDVDVQKYSYTYLTYLVDNCGGISPVSNAAKTIVLRLDMEGNDILKHDPVLSWGAYREWSSGVDFYRLEFLDEEQNTHALVSKNPPDRLTAKHRYVNTDQRNYCYKVTAYQKDSNHIFSESNTTCISTKPVIHAPNVFTINGDNINDTYKMQGIFVDEFELNIYNRWGQKVFETRDINQGWDGTYNGSPCQVDVYYYLATGRGKKGQYTELKGNITLIR